MDIKDALSLARELIQPFKDSGQLGQEWRVEFDFAKRRFGRCNHRTKTISLSSYLVTLNNETEVKDTILHELAHALTPGAGHGWKWKLKAAEIGARPSRCYTDAQVVTVKRKWVAECATCGRQIQRHKRNFGMACGVCCRANGGGYQEKFKFTWRANI